MCPDSVSENRTGRTIGKNPHKVLHDPDVIGTKYLNTSAEVNDREAAKLTRRGRRSEHQTGDISRGTTVENDDRVAIPTLLGATVDEHFVVERWQRIAGSDRKDTTCVARVRDRNVERDVVGPSECVCFFDRCAQRALGVALAVEATGSAHTIARVSVATVARRVHKPRKRQAKHRAELRGDLLRAGSHELHRQIVVDADTETADVEGLWAVAI